MNKWLICTHHVFGWGGSELVAIELVEELLSRGIEVSLYSPYIERDFARLVFNGAIPLFNYPTDIDLMAFDVVYVQHQTLSRLIPHQSGDIMASPHRPLFVFNHLSPFEPFEFPGPFIEADIADLILCNSPETARRLGEFGDAFAAPVLFANPAPRRFAARNDGARNARLQRVLAVSNHLPADLSDALDALSSIYDVEVTRLGLPGPARRVTPEDIAAHDAVITIGKTVQYALRGDRPVFVYDRFGGPGWLSASNFAAARDTNFSGRSAPRITPPDILAAEIVGGYETAELPDAYISADAAAFKLEAEVDRLFERLADRRADRPAPAAALDPDPARLARWRHEAVLYDLVDQQFCAIYPRVSKILQDRYHGLDARQGDFPEAAIARLEEPAGAAVADAHQAHYEQESWGGVVTRRTSRTRQDHASETRTTLDMIDIQSIPSHDQLAAEFLRSTEDEPAARYLKSVYETGVMFDEGDHREILNDSCMDAREGNILWYLTRQLKPELVIETGFGRGGSAAFFLTALAPWGGRLISIDPAFRHWAGDTGQTYVRHLGMADHHRVIERASEFALPAILEADPDQRLKLAYVDGSHHFDGTLIDFMFFDKIVEVGGIIGIDDAHAPAVRTVASYVANNLPYRLHYVTPRLVLCQKIAETVREWDHFRPFTSSSKADWDVHFQAPTSGEVPNATVA